MSKRPPTNGNPANGPAAKKSRIDIDDTVAEAKTMFSSLLDSLKAQKTAAQWGHAGCREDTVANIPKAESMVCTVEKLEKKSKDASATVDKLIDALVKTQYCALIDVLRARCAADEDRCMGQTMFVDGLLDYKYSMDHDVAKQVKEKLQGLTVDEVIKKVKAETKTAYKAAAKKQFLNVLEDVLN
ncbi:hypothetical protein E4T48_03612 [Aureobasidium sp. EXF-10727]|nr:hypothetical protein E4T48_03612 [Aureobasidium sp. EXF-10727]